ncbi:hypothetical protein FGO68_gene1872 [Halteria grandinella]|uniref:Uncharacterized protein n=1 Tax=Halteria grandinella TaxID=5974 RepID=A0A8J8T947_HALGN|nr:hypothetical protein FGO68_gene1872 [Halteria grandinella]
MSSPFAFYPNEKRITVYTTDLPYSQLSKHIYNITVKAAYNHGQSQYDFSFRVDIKHPCNRPSISINKSTPYFSTLSESVEWIHDVYSSTIDLIQLTWTTSSVGSTCRIQEYQFTDNVNSAISMSNSNNEIKIATSPTDPSRNSLLGQYSISYEGYIISSAISTTYGFPILSSLFKVKFISCLEHFRFSEPNVTYFINDDAELKVYYYQDITTRSSGCSGITFTLQFKNSAGGFVPFINNIVTVDTIRRAIIINTQDLTWLSTPSQPYEITLIGAYPDGMRTFPSIKFYLNFKDPCIEKVAFNKEDTQVQGYQVTSDKSYMLHDPLLTVQIQYYQSLHSYSHCGVQKDKITVKNNNGLEVLKFPSGAGDFIKYDGTQDLLFAFSKNYKDFLNQPYLVEITSYYEYYPQLQGSYTFQLSVFCTTSRFLPQNENLDYIFDSLYSTPDYTYTIRANILKIPITPFRADYYCGQEITKYELLFYKEGIKEEAISEFVIFKENAVEIYSENRTHMVLNPSFSLVIKGYIEDPYTSNIIEGAMTTPVNMVIENNWGPEFTRQLYDVEVELNIPKQLRFPNITDKDVFDEPSVVLNSPLFDPLLAPYIRGKFPTYTILVISSYLEDYQFPVSVKLTDNNPYIPKFTDYSFKIKVKAGNYSQTVNESNSTQIVYNSTLISIPVKQRSNLPLTVKISSVSQFGEMRLTFNQDIIFPLNNLTELNIVGLFKNVQILQPQDFFVRKITKYQVTRIESNYILTQLTFAQPLSISSGFGYDIVKVKFSNQFVIAALSNPNITLPKEANVTSTVPPQLLNNYITKTVQSATEKTSTSMVVIISANIALTLAGGFSMKKMWQLISVLQILIHYPMLNIPVPGNVVLVMKGIQEISNLNLIPKNKINQLLSKVLQSTQDELYGSFQQMGYDSTNFLQNMGLVFIVLILTCGLIMIILLLGFLIRKSRIGNMLIEKIKLKLMFNPIIQAQLKGYIKFNLAILIALANVCHTLCQSFLAIKLRFDFFISEFAAFNILHIGSMSFYFIFGQKATNIIEKFRDKSEIRILLFEYQHLTLLCPHKYSNLSLQKIIIGGYNCISKELLDCLDTHYLAFKPVFGQILAAGQAFPLQEHPLL